MPKLYLSNKNMFHNTLCELSLNKSLYYVCSEDKACLIVFLDLYVTDNLCGSISVIILLALLLLLLLLLTVILLLLF